MTSARNNDKTFKVLASEAVPKWDVLRQHIRRQVLEGEFLPGDILPSEAVLCEQFGVARTTVRHALDQLEQEGIIQRVKGKGTFVGHARISERPMRSQQVFCLVLPEVKRDVYPVLINGFSEEAMVMNHQVMLATTNNQIYRQGDIMLQVLDKKMAGVALVPMFEHVTPPHHVRQLQENGIPVVLCNRPIEGVSAPLVTWDFEDIGRIAGRHFLQRGHRRIGYFANLDHPMIQAHLRGLREVLAEQGLDMPDNNVILMSSLQDSDRAKYEVIQKRLGAADRPTAFLCNDDTEAENVFWAAHDMGLKVPQDVALIGFGVPWRDGLFRERLSSVVMDGYELGRKAAKLLAEMRFGKRPMTSDEVFYISLDFVPGETA